MSWIYRPDHPFANENGMIERAWAEQANRGPGFYVVSDEMPPMRHMATGRVHDSKSEFRKDTRAAGCEEMGTDPAARRAKPHHQVSQADVVPDVKRAIEQLRSR